MIQFNKTIFQFTKRLALVVLLIGISNAVWSSNTYYYSRVKAEATINGVVDGSVEGTEAKNLVYVSESQITGNKTINWEESTTLHKASATGEEDENNANEAGTWQLPKNAKEKWQEGHVSYDLRGNPTDNNMSHTYFLYAKKDPKYLFSGWYNGDVPLKTVTEYANDVTVYEYAPSAIRPSMTLTAHQTSGEWYWPTNTYTFDYPEDYDLVATARYLVPTVVSVEWQLTAITEYRKTIMHNNPAKTTIIVPVEFGVQNALAKDNFILKIDNVEIPATNTTWSYANSKVTVDVTIDLTNYNGNTTVTLQSHYSGSADKAATYTCIIEVTEDYIPRFHVAKDSKVFRAQDEVSNVDEFIATLLNDAAKHPNTIWTTEITGVDANCFTFVTNAGGADSKNTPNPRIKFHYSGDEPDNEYSAELRISCKYSTNDSEILDATGNVLRDDNDNIVNVKVIPLSARFDPVILFDDEEDKVLPLTTLIATSENDFVSVDIPYRHNLETPPTKGDVEANPAGLSCITFGELPQGKTGNVTVSVNKNTNPGNYTATLSVSGIASGNTIDATLTAQVRIELATPTLNATTGDNKVTFTWASIPHANKYVLVEVPATGGTWTDAQLIGQDYNTNLFTSAIGAIEKETNASFDHTVVNDNQYYYCIVALYVNGGKVVDSKTSAIVSFMPSITPKTITLGTSLLNIYTGTKDNHADDESQFPLRKKRQVNVSAAFDETGKTLFNRLYIFGHTTDNNNNELSSITNLTNIKTPCYIYESQVGSMLYELVKTIPNMNATSKDAALTINAGNGMKYYFTGYCPFATTGSSYNEQGVIQIIGGDRVDIYLDDLQAYSRDKSDASFELNTNSLSVFGELAGTNYASYPLGSGAVFALTATSANFKPTIHIRGNNILDATEGLKITKASNITFEPSAPSGGFVQYSSPIQVLPTISGTTTDVAIGASNKTELTIDDTWPASEGTIRTNGALSLQENKGGNGSDWTETNIAPSIDLGLASTKLNLSGGQIFMKNATRNSSTMAISRIQSSSLKITVNVSSKTEDFQTTFYGLACNTETYLKDNQVSIIDGTINNGTNNPEALKLPTNTTVDGGTFNCNIQAGDANEIKNKDGLALAYFDDIVVSAWDNTNANGTANMTRFNEMMDYLFPHAGVNDNDGYHRSLSMYYVEGKTYGHESLTPNADGKVRMLLPPLPADGIKFAWQICSPDFTANINGEPRPLGGAIDNINSCGVPGHAPYIIDYLLYMEMDEYTRTIAQNKHQIPFQFGAQEVNIQVSVADNDLHKSIGNTNKYDIQKKVYMLKPIVAGEWTMFVAPFNVTNVYVIEAYPDAQIQKDFGTPMGYGDYIIESHNVESARQAQAKRILDLYTFWYLAETDMRDASDFFGTEKTEDTNGDGQIDKYGVFVDYWMAYEAGRGMNGAAPAEGSNYTPIIEPLYHYTGNTGSYPEGMRWWDAHYYLYKSNDKKWEYAKPANADESSTEKKLITDWEIVDTQAGGTAPIMTKGEIYTMQFPSAINSTPQDWNYWTGKYILLEGNGQELNGSDLAATVVTPDENEACVIGNASFANIEVSRTDQLFQLNKNANNVYNFDLVGEAIAQISVKPTSGYMLANIPITTTQETNEEGQIVETQKIAKSISMETGEVIYDIKTTIIDNGPGLGSGLPTIMGDVTLIVEPTSEGLTITPLKEQHVMLFDAEGKMIFSKYMSEEENVSLPTGVYVVRGEYEQVKAIKK